MHELSVCQALIEQLITIVAENQARSVHHIKVCNGPLSGVDSHFLKQAFTVARLGTVAEHAELSIDREPIQVRCSVCGQEGGATANSLVCPHCGDWRTEVLSGDALLLVSVELS